MEEHSRGYAEVRDGLQHLDQRLTFLDQKVDRFREELMGANAATNARIEALDQRLSGRIDALDQKVSKQFVWLVGIQIMVLLAVIGALLGK